MDFTAWLKAWLGRHPLQEPDAPDRARYTAQVMRQITDKAPLSTPAARWFAWPRVAMAFATTAAGVLIILSTGYHADRQLAQDVPRSLRLAESTTSDDAWVQNTLQLLEQLGEDPSDDGAHTTSDEEWFRELQTLDEGDLNANS